MGKILIDEKFKCKKSPGLIQRIFFWWLCPIFYWGNRRDLEENDLVNTKEAYRSKRLGDELERSWDLECKEAQQKKRTPSLLKVLAKTFKWKILFPLIPNLIALFLRTSWPLLFGRLLTYWTPNSTTTLQDASLYAALMVVSFALVCFIHQHEMLFQTQLGMSVRISITSLMYRKLMRMSPKSLSDSSVGKMVNLMSNDLGRFDNVFLHSHHIFWIPLQLSIIVYFVYMSIGISAIVGIAIIVVVMTPLQVFLTKILKKMRLASAARTDSRIRAMDEIIKGVQVIKMYAWEESFTKAVHETRKHEIAAITRSSWIRLGILGYRLITQRTSLFFSILCFMMLGNQMTAEVLFPLQQFLFQVQTCVGVLIPAFMFNATETLIAVKRIEEFLSLEERPDLVLPSTDAMELSEQNVVAISQGKLNKGFVVSESSNIISENIIELKNIEARWSADGPTTLSNISLKLKPGQLCAVIGAVGSGKSSLLQLLIREFPHMEGSLIVNGKVSYAAQEPWLFPKSVRENILFGMSYNFERYKEVCKVCCLERDFRQFEFGDQTLVGERGVILSGGQKARINLARAVYREADIYLLDDPLSAVDTKVGRKLYEECISGFLKGKTTVLITHQLHHLTTADIIVVLEDGKVKLVGRYEELHTFVRLFEDVLFSQHNRHHKEVNGKTSENKQPRLKRSDSTVSGTSEISEEYSNQKLAPEERSKGTIKLSVLTAYCTSGGYTVFALTMLLMVSAQGIASYSDYWLSFWMNQIAEYEVKNGPVNKAGLESQMGPLKSAQYLLIYGVLIALCLVITISRSFMFVAMCMKSCTALHNKMFSSMLTAVMRFFNNSSSGRILNRFSKDMGAVDELLPKFMMDTLQLHLIALSALILNAVALPLTIALTSILFFTTYIFTKLYLKASQALKRIEGTTKSPVFGLVSSSFNGIATIRSFNAQKRLIANFDETQDIHTNAWNTVLGASSAFGHFFDLAFTVYFSFIFFVFLYFDFGELIPIGDVGLAVSQSLQMTYVLQFGARSATDAMAQLTAVERVLEYTKLETEDNLKEGKIRTPDDWPSQGEVVFEGIDMSYGPESPPVIKNLSFTIPAGAKVGIVGRTGAGKSSLISALFRFAYIKGKIIIDGVDTELIAKQELRSRISIIPQEPVLFSATIRFNLDPFNKASDMEIWKVIELVQLKDAIPALDYKVSEGGGNFSVGQRQLVCLARAVLTSNKILVMDEATANVDPQTDSLIQKTIRSQFASCTVLTIAHRLNTIMDSDLVLVMDAGEAVEFDHPHNLLSDSNSKFSSMVNETGSNMATHLRKIAMDAYLSENNLVLTERL